MKRTELGSIIGFVPVPEKELRDFGKSIGIIFGHVGDDAVECKKTKWVNNLLRTLLDTANYPSLSVTHQVAAINGLCGCIEQCIDSSEDEILRFACSPEVHRELYVIYTERLDGTRMKSAKQLQSTLVRLLAKSGAIEGTSECIDRTSSLLLDILCQGEDRTKAKLALLALTIFLSRGLLDPGRLAALFGQSLNKSTSSTSDTSVPQNDFQALLNLVLNWISVPDLAPAAGHLLSTLLSMNTKPPTTREDATESGALLPIWVQPIMRGVEENFLGLQAFKVHAFPPLFRANVADYWRFLLFLGIETLLSSEKIQVGKVQDDLSDLKSTVLFAALETGKAVGLVSEFDASSSEDVSFRNNVVWIPVKTLGRLCNSSSNDAQLAGLILMISTPNSTQPLTPGTLSQLRTQFPNFHAESDATVRSEVHSLTQALLNRHRTVTSNIAHKIELQKRERGPVRAQLGVSYTKTGATSYTLQATLEDHKSFLCWFIDFLSAEIHGTVSYQRHISALKALLCVAKSGLDSSVDKRSLSKQARTDPPWPFQIRIFNGLLHRSLFDLLLDPYDDVRQTSLALLKMSNARALSEEPDDRFRHSIERHVSTALNRAETAMVVSGRVDHADGVARFYDLLGVLHADNSLSTPVTDRSSAVPSILEVLDHLIRAVEQSLVVARTSMYEAVGKHSIHGLYTALRYVLEELASADSFMVDRSFLNPILIRISDSFNNTWRTVHYLLCNDAPEGFVPEDMEEEPELTTKDALSYAWRALKESSLVLRSLVSLKLTDDGNTSSSTPALSLKYLGDLCFTQLAELRHRGAFSTVAQTYATVCHYCNLSQDVDTQGLIVVWYERTLVLIGQRGSAITRRSAGIPAIITALLGANPNGLLFDKAITDLKDLSKLSPKGHGSDGVTDLPQVHAINCMRAIFTTSKLGNRSEQYVGDVMKVAADCMNHDIWAIRNCGLMLFRSLIDRLLGSDETQNGAASSSTLAGRRMSYQNHPGLLELMVQLLTLVQESHSQLSTEAIFFVLDLLRRAPPPENERDAIRMHILQIMGNTNWHIRDIAARTFAAFAPQKKVPETIEMLLSTIKLEQNNLHGHLLCVKYLVKDVLKFSSIEQVQQLLVVTESGMRAHKHEGMNDIILATYMDIWNEFGLCVLLWPTRGLTTCHYLVDQYTAHVTDLQDTIAQSRNPSPLYPLLGQATVVSMLISQVVHFTFSKPRGDDLGSNAKDTEKVVKLLTCDAYGTSEILQTLRERLNAASQDVLQAFLTMLAELFDDTLPSTSLAAIERSFVEVLVKMHDVAQVMSDSTIPARLGRIDPMSSFTIQQAPSDFESSLSIWGCVLTSKHRTIDRWTDALVEEMGVWLQYVRAALDERNEFPLRFAAGLSLHTFSISSTGLQNLPTILYTAYIFAVYDTLCDDDDEIRILGASIVPNIVKATTGNSSALGLTPPVAVQMLCTHLIVTDNNSPMVINESISRLVGQRPSKVASLIPLKHMLNAAMNKETVLFDEEKLNLYIDPVKEAATWSHVLKRSSLVNCPQATIDSFTTWTTEGLETLISLTRSQIDGPLGWTSKPDVFALGMRVLCATDALLELRTKSRKVKVRGSFLRRKLRELADVGGEMELHGLWLKKIELVLARSVEQRLRMVVGVLAGLPGGVC